MINNKKQDMAMNEEFHKLASDIDLTPSQKEVVLDFIIEQMIRVARTNVNEEDILNQVRERLETKDK